jgi:hypothetical protein
MESEFMPTTKTYQVVGGKAKIQIEDLLGTKPSGGWVYQAPGQGNKGAEGAHYYFKSQTQQGSLKSAPDFGRFSFQIDVEDAGTYSILLRATRDTDNPGDARNDIWIKVDGGTQGVMPKGTPTLTSGGDGFVKFKGAQTKWMNAHTFSTHQHGDKNPESDVVLSKGMHTITFAPRSTGFHIDSVQIIKKGGAVSVMPEPKPLPEPEPKPLPEPLPEPLPKPLPAPGLSGQTKAVAAAVHDDFESNKMGRSADLELGRDGDGAQSVGLRFQGLTLEEDAEIESAYFVFTAAETGKGKARFTIEVENTTAAASYSPTDAPDDRAYLAEDVAWNVGGWNEGRKYQSADVSELIEAVIGDGGLDALDALAFRITGSGERVAEAFESGAGAPELVINYEIA